MEGTERKDIACEESRMSPAAKTNFHTHSRWCDGKDSTEDMVRAAFAVGFSTIGFSSHAMLPAGESGNLTSETAPLYFAEIRALAEKWRGKIEILCGVEADYIPGTCTPDRSSYASLTPDYIIGSIHNVVKNGLRCPVDHAPDLLKKGIDEAFAGNPIDFVRAYFAQEREMAASFDFDVVGHPDLVRKFNTKHPYFDESAPWYLEELRLTADAIAASGKIVEVNTGAISRGWLSDAYPSPFFRKLLRERGVKFILSSDAHSATAIDCAFDHFSGAEAYLPRIP